MSFFELKCEMFPRLDITGCNHILIFLCKLKSVVIIIYAHKLFIQKNSLHSDQNITSLVCVLYVSVLVSIGASLQTSLDESFQVLLDQSLVFSLVQMQLAFTRLARLLLGGSDSFSGRRKLFWGNDDHLKSRAALSFQLDLLVLQQYSCAIWTLRRNYRGISLDETLLESSRGESRMEAFEITQMLRTTLSLSSVEKDGHLRGPYPSISALIHPHP